MKRCVLNVSVGGWFPRGQDRLAVSIKEFSNGVDTLFWKDCLPNGCPAHKEHPYAFKPYAIMEAIKSGYDTILWADASVWAVKDISQVFSFIESHGYMFFANSYIGYFSSDRCLEHFGISRDVAMSMREIMGCCFGLNLKDHRTMHFFEEYYHKSTDGITFPGAWENSSFEASKDSRVKGHRHDQTVASILAHRMNMNDFIVPHETFMCYKSQIPHYYPNSNPPETVCLLNEGM